MPVELIPIKVKIGIRAKNGRREHAFPNFNLLPSAVRGGMDWSHFVDEYGGWKYDKVAGHDVDDVPNGSPRGTWLGMLLVPEDFANAAIDMFPEVEEMTANEAEVFHDGRCTAHMPDFQEDEAVLNSIERQVKEGLLSENDPAVVNARNPDNDAPGRRRNKNKKFADVLTRHGFTVKQRPKRKRPNQ